MHKPERHEEQSAHHQSHRAAVLDAEVRLLVDQLEHYGGTLEREDLARRVDAGVWREGTFDAALNAGVERGILELLPEGLVGLRRR